MANVLIIDDDKGMCFTLSGMVTQMGHDVICHHTLNDGFNEASMQTFDVLFLDVGMPDGNGLELLPMILQLPDQPEVIIFTGDGDSQGAEQAIKSGAWDYIEKPASLGQIQEPLLRAIQYRKKKSKRTSTVDLKRDDIVGESSQINNCLNLLARAAGNQSNVLISGETGTGKELFAKAIHRNSPRSENNFVVVDCAALPETLVETVLFGHVKGAFTGAVKEQEGLIKQADKGTLFLDEVGELPLSVQKAFLRVLQERRYRPVGYQDEIPSDFRVVAATNRNIEKMVASGKFRKDLMFRLRSIEIDLPPLIARDNDVLHLAYHFAATYCSRYHTENKSFSPDFLKVLSAYHWPGNIRELANAIEWSISVACDEPTLFPIHLPDYIRTQLTCASISSKALPEAKPQGNLEKTLSFPKLRQLVEATERQYLKDLLSYTKGDVKAVCCIAGLSRANVYKRLKKYDISRHYNL